MINAALVIFTSTLAQAAGAVFLAIVLLGFHRLYERSYLLAWTWSWWAFCVSLLSGAVALYLVPFLPPDAPARLAASIVTLTAAYWQAAWLLFGTYEVLKDRSVRRRTQRLILAALLAFSLLSIGLSLYVGPNSRFVVRIGVRSLV